jgi:hypothetical protein
MCIELRDLLKEYDRRVGLALIPFYLSKQEYIQQEIKDCRSDNKQNLEDEKFLKKMLENIKKSLD